MARPAGEPRIHPDWWTAILVVFVIGSVALTWALFNGSFKAFVPVTLESDRAGLVMEVGAAVKMRGVEVGRVRSVTGGRQPVSLQLALDPDKVRYLPSNVNARIASTTIFGAKYVDLIYPDDPSGTVLAAGDVLRSQNVSTEVNTVFQDLVGVIDKIDPAKLNSVLSAVAEGVRGQGPRMGEATTAANDVLAALNDRSDTIRDDWRSFRDFNDTYAGAAADILRILDSASTTGATVASQAHELDALLVNVIGFSDSGIQLLGPNKDNLVRAVNVLRPTTDLLMKYNPELTCLIVGGKNALDFGQTDYTGGANGKSLIVDAALLLGDDPYRYPDNLPRNGAKGGPGGKPGCASLPDVAKNWPVRTLITDTGWGTGLDNRPNPGIGFPGWANFFPVTRAVPEPPSIRYPGGPAPGPVPGPGAPPYGAAQYGADGTPLYPAVPPLPAPESPPLIPPGIDGPAPDSAALAPGGSPP
ncbi:MCE family protein [Mycolicibacterium helvum]|uniref:Virulence factor n=1 Tax=Mycolicibacterium helvum TaxID=1534349 RepID=A0A7I7TD67_9MYCO|nr:MCE family protein [Mycolicibacterium helvum]BBY66096.1 virulence factor [Mycolicibacterium helvum]